MRIERIELDGFGHFAGERWSLAPGMTVMLGENEAGKSTLLNAIRALLFGFEATRDGKTWYPALSGGRRGGRLLIVTESGERWTVERHGERGGQGTLTVRAPNGSQGGTETLDRLLGRADRDLFNNIFAFGLGELESFSSLSSEGVASRIYGAGTGLGGVSALDLERRLRAEQEVAYKPRGRDQALNQLLSRIDDLHARIAELERQPAEHAAKVAELSALRRRHAELKTARLAAAERSERLRRLLDAQPLSVQLDELERTLAAGDPHADMLAPDVEAGLDRRLAAAEQAERALDEVNAEIEERERQLGGLQVDRALIAEGPEIVSLRDERQMQEQRTGLLHDAQAVAGARSAELAELLRRVGGWTEERLLALDDSIAAVDGTRQAEQQLTATAASLARLNQRVESARADVATAERELGHNGTLDEAELRDRRAALNALVEIDRRLMAADERDRLLAELGASRTPRRQWLQPAGAGLVVALAAAVVVGTGTGMPWAGVVAGGLLGVVTFLALARLRRGTSSDSLTASARAAILAERAAALERAGLPPDADPATVADAGTELAIASASLRDADARTARLAERREALERLEAELNAAQDASDAARQAWMRWLAERSLPEDASPEAARQILAAVGTAHRAVEQRDEQLRRAAAIAEAAAAFDARVEALLGRLGRQPVATGRPRATEVIGLAEQLDAARAAQQRQAELQTSLASLGVRHEALATAAAERRDELDAFLREHAVANPDELRTLAALAAERRGVQQRLREVRAALAGIAGSEEAVPALLAAARGADPAELTAQRADADAEAERLEAQESETLTAEGALRAGIAQLEAAEALGEARQELAGAQAQAEDEARRWAVRAIALALLAETRHRYERERQPQVVQDAERYFATITGGRYPRILAPAGETSVLVERDEGSPLAPDQLSRGTAEQLYLALRFGLIEQFARAAEPLPVVMDDILVNFDQPRAERAARAIGQLATRHQVLFFTCHPRIAELLDPDGVATQRLGQTG